MENLPLYISVVFILTTLATVFLFYKAAHNSKPVAMLIILWLVVQAIIGLSGFYKITSTVPPRFLLTVAPPALFIAFLFFSKGGRAFIDKLDTKALTIIHVVRLPVEIVLYWLFIQKFVPQVMTFEGWNFDITSGLTAPLIYYFGFIQKKLNGKIILAWNIACLGLLINIVVTAILSAPFPFQKLAFDQPNIALLYFPFIWLPCCIVPIVLLSHLVSIRQLLRPKI